MPRTDYLSRGSMEGRKITPGVIFSAIGGSIIIIQGVLVLLYGESLIYFALESQMQTTLGLDVGLTGAFGIIIGICVLGGSYLISWYGFQTIGGVVVIVFSLVSIVTGGGWLVGLAFGMIGGILGLISE
jgi:hypothetical protein